MEDQVTVPGNHSRVHPVPPPFLWPSTRTRSIGPVAQECRWCLQRPWLGLRIAGACGALGTACIGRRAARGSSASCI